MPEDAPLMLRHPVKQGAPQLTQHSVFTITNLIIGFAFAISVTLVNLVLTDKLISDRAFLAGVGEVVTINVADMLLGFVTGNAPDISQVELQRRTRALNTDLEAVVASLAKEHGFIVVNAGSVLAGARDITPMVLDRMRNTAAFGGQR